MNEQWTHYNPVNTYFGRGCLSVLLEQVANRRCLVVTSARGRRQLCANPTLAQIVNQSQVQWLDEVRTNPDINDLQADIKRRRGQNFDTIIGFGGGSALDSAKVLAVALSSELKGYVLSELLENPELHKAVEPIKLYAVPTTAGTGSEVTPFATVWDHEKREKHSLNGSGVFPHSAFVDPALTDDLPVEITLSTGLDAINQAVESIWNKNATPLSIDYATRALRLGFPALRNLVENKGGITERDQMAGCSLLAGLAISQTRTALCHSISYPITVHLGVPHGLACAFTMSAVLGLNLSADDGRLRQLEKELGFLSLQKAFDDLNKQLKVAELFKKYVPTLNKLLELVGEMYTPSRADNNIAPVDRKIIGDLIKTSWNNPHQ